MLQSAEKKDTQNHNTVSAEVNALSSTRPTERTDRQTERQTTKLRGDIAADKQMAGKWVDGQKGVESSSQTDRKTDGRLTGGQTDGQNDK